MNNVINNDINSHRIVLVAPDRLFRETLAARVTSAGLEVAKVASKFDDVPRDMLDDEMLILVVRIIDEGDGTLEALARFKGENSAAKLLIITNTSSAASIATWLEIGANTILDEDVSFDSFLHYLRFIALDEQVLPANMVNAVFRTLRPYLTMQKDGPKIPSDLTRREQIILAYLTEGASNKHIARYLDVADGTVKICVKTILRKINACNRTQAAVWALQHDIRGQLLSEGVELSEVSGEMSVR